MAATIATTPAGRSSSSPAWASSPRSAPARPTTGSNLTAGKSGIQTITRFATEGLKTRIAGTVDFVPAEPLSAPDIGRAPCRPRRRGGDRQVRDRQPRRFPRAAVHRGGRRSRSNGSSAEALRRASGANASCQLRRPHPRRRRAGSFTPITSASCSARSPTAWPTNSAPKARRSRCRPPAPRARPRSSSASRRSGAAKPTRRCASAPTARSIRRA